MDENIISKIKLPGNDTVYNIAVKWENIKNKPEVDTGVELIKLIDDTPVEDNR